MNQKSDLTADAKSIIDTNIYMVLGTADESGIPWVSPVYFASSRYTDFYWDSSPEARHSHNISVRSRISIVIFDSRAAIGTGTDLEAGIEVYSGHSLAHGGSQGQTEQV